ncbi:hypothetical protein DL93DRAFT_923028 [Clavulina sp. PMI_390]|nr:hypothetical protein DL93DRAFT_923028 [Clavulina sp. PMI_390]
MFFSSFRKDNGAPGLFGASIEQNNTLRRRRFRLTRQTKAPNSNTLKNMEEDFFDTSGRPKGRNRGYNSLFRAMHRGVVERDGDPDLNDRSYMSDAMRDEKDAAQLASRHRSRASGPANVPKPRSSTTATKISRLATNDDEQDIYSDPEFDSILAQTDFDFEEPYYQVILAAMRIIAFFSDHLSIQSSQSVAPAPSPTQISLARPPGSYASSGLPPIRSSQFLHGAHPLKPPTKHTSSSSARPTKKYKTNNIQDDGERPDSSSTAPMGNRANLVPVSLLGKLPAHAARSSLI